MKKFKECCTSTLALCPTAKCCCECGSSLMRPITKTQYYELYNMFLEIAANQKEYYQVRDYDCYWKTTIIDIILDVKKKTLSITMQDTKCMYIQNTNSLKYILEERAPHTKSLELGDCYFTNNLTKEDALTLFYSSIHYYTNFAIKKKTFTAKYNKAKKLINWLANPKG